MTSVRQKLFIISKWGAYVVKKLIKFEIGILIGTIIGATVAAIICSMCFSAFGYQVTDIAVIQDCLQQEISNRLNK